MKKIILLLCLVMFMCVNAKHYKKYNKNPNATILVKLSYKKKKKNTANKKTVGLWSLDGQHFNKLDFLHVDFFQSVKVEPGYHEIVIRYEYARSFTSATLKHDFEADKTYTIRVYSNNHELWAKIIEEETE